MRKDRRGLNPDRVLLSISCRITGQYVDLLRGLLERERSAVAIDLKDVLHVDVENRLAPMLKTSKLSIVLAAMLRGRNS